MDQFGLNLKFLGIIQVSSIIFVLKINFPNYFSILSPSGLRAKFQEGQEAARIKS
jgi:hypothetical protein